MLDAISFIHLNADHNCLCFIHDADITNDPIGSVAFHMILLSFLYEFKFWNVHGIMNTSVSLQSK